MNKPITNSWPVFIAKPGFFFLVTLILITGCFSSGKQASGVVTSSTSAANTPNATTPTPTLVSTPVPQINLPTHPPETPIEIPLETSTPTSEGASSCPVTSIQEDFWSAVGPVAGDFPVWISSLGRVPYSKLGRIVLPPDSGELTFNEGRSTKALVFVDKSIEGDLTITGKRLDGPELVYFTDSEGLFTDIDDTTMQLVKLPPTVKTISSAHISSHFPEPPGKAHHGMGLLYLSPGCYQFTATINQYTVQIVLELVNQ